VVNYTYTITNISGAPLYYVGSTEDKVSLVYVSGFTNTTCGLYTFTTLATGASANFTASANITQTTTNTFSATMAKTIPPAGLCFLGTSDQTTASAQLTVTVQIPAGSLSCNTIYFSGDVVGAKDGRIGTINTTTAATTSLYDVSVIVSPAPFNGSAALALDPVDPTSLYFIPRDATATTANYGSLYRLSTAGTATIPTSTPATTAANTPDANRLSVAPDQSLWTIVSGIAYRWTPATSWVSKGTVALSTAEDWALYGSGDIAFDGDGTLYLLVANTTTNPAGAAKLFTITKTELNDGAPLAQLVGQMSTGLSFNGIAFNESGVLYATSTDLSIGTTTLYTVNIASGTATAVGSSTTYPVTDLASCALPQADIQVVKSVSPTGTVAAGTTLTYTIAIKNVGTLSSTNTNFLDLAPANTTLVAGSTTLDGAVHSDYITTQEVHSTGNLNGVISPGATSVVTFKVKTSPTFNGQICNQGKVNYTGNTEVLTDDVNLPGGADPTCVTNKVPDNDGDGVADNDDLDDDNDGILDTVENVCPSPAPLFNTPPLALSTDFTAGGTNVNTGGFIPNAASNAGHRGTTATLNGLYGGLINFTGSLGTPTDGAQPVSWRGQPATAGVGGIQLLNTPAVPGGSYIYMQPQDGDNPTALPNANNTAKYVMDLTQPISNFAFTIGGINGNDVMTYQAFYQGVEIPLTAANFIGLAGGVTVSPYTLSGAKGMYATNTNTAGGTDPLLNVTTLTIPGPVDKIVMTSGKLDNTNSTVTLGIYGIQGCPAPDTDGDGIANYLDLDSDGDGCPDAIEGGSTSITTANLATSTLPGGNSGVAYIGTSSVPVTQNLGNTVGSTGIPTTAGAGQAIGNSQNPAINDCAVPISGNVFNDINGGNVNGVSPNLAGLNANLLDASGNVVATVPVNQATGAYTFPSANPGTYTVQLSTNVGVPSQPAPAQALPTGWANTGDFNGTPNTGTNAASINGVSEPFTVVSTAVTNINFGIEQPPLADTKTAPTVLNPGGTVSATVPSATFAGTDPSAGGSVTDIVIKTIPVGATSITINGIKYDSANPIPTGGITIPAPGGVPSQPILVDPVDGAVTVPIEYFTKDNAGLLSVAPGIANVPFAVTSIAGNVFNDLNAANVDGTGTNAGGLNANLIGADGKVVATVPVNSGGDYIFPSVAAGTYTVQISTVAGTLGVLAPAQTLPTGWINTGDFNGTPGSGTNAGSIDGVSQPVTATLAPVTNINFGIEQPPTANTVTLTPQPNPGGTVNSPNLASSFGGTDPSGGTITAIKITAFPTNTTSITIGGTPYTTLAAIQAAYPNGIPTNTTGQPTTSITVDPINGNVTVGIPYVTVDNAGKESLAPGAVNVPFVSPSVAGNVFNDLNGVSDNTVNGGLPPAGLNANLLDAAGNVVATTAVDPATGKYKFDNVAPGNYSVQLNTTAGTVGSPAPTVALPTGWVTTGENNGTVGTDGTPNSKSAVIAVSTTDVTEVNFGIEQPPTANTATVPVQANPGGTVSVPVTTQFGGTDPTGGAVTAIKITAFPTNTTSITINGVPYTTLATITAAYPNGIPTSPAGVPTVPILIDPIDGNVTAVIPYNTVDAAGKESLVPGAVNVPFATASVAGNVFNDLNGNTDNTVNGIVPPTGLNANLLDGAGNVVATTPIKPDGTYKFDNVAPGNYSVQLNITAGTPGMPAPAVVTLPTGFVTTGENNGTVGTDGTPNSKSAVFAVSTSPVTDINFGIEQPPTANAATVPSQANPNGTVSVPITTQFGGTDPSGGTVAAIKLTAFPTNTTSITINGTPYTTLAAITAAYLNGIPTNAAGVPTVPILIDPVDGNVTAVIPYNTVDNAGKESLLPGAVNVPFVSASVAGNVFNDVNGNTDNTVNGILPPAGLNANLLDAAGNVVATTPIKPDGTYKFDSVAPGNYSVQLNTTAGTPGMPAPAVVTLPAGFVTTGENNGAGTGTDGTPNSKSNVFAVNTTDVTDINFGIEQPPTANIATVPAQANPNGTVSVPITDKFGGADPDGGIVKAIIITAFPTNTTSIMINGVPYTTLAAITAAYPNGIPTDATGKPSVPILIDPIDGNVTAVIPYNTVDNAGKVSPIPGTVNVPFVSPSVSGNVFDDANGLVDNKVNGALPPAGLNANLLNSAGNVVATVPVQPDGTYKFDNVAPGNYSVQLNTNVGEVGMPAPPVELPAGFVTTGENNDVPANTGSDRTPDSKSAVFAVSTTPVTNINFGIEQQPVAKDVTAASHVNPGGTTKVAVPPLDITDAEDGTPTTVTITTLPAAGILYYDGNPVVAGTPIPNFNPAKLTVDPIDGAVTVTFPYTTTDVAGKTSPEATVTMPFTTVNVSGTVFNDPNAGNVNNSTGAANSVPAGLTAYLVDNVTGKVVGTSLVATDGTYSISDVNGGTYKVVTSVVAAAIGDPAPAATPPTGFVQTGEFTGTPDGGTDAAVNGTSVPFTIATADQTNVNFGIQAPPTAGTDTAPSVVNPGGTASSTVPPATFSGTDPDGGTVESIVIKTIPVGATSITINGTKYDSTNPIPVGGITIPAPGGVPTQPILVDPVDGALTVPIEYFTKDNGGKESVLPGIANVPFTTVNVSGTVFNDPNAGNVNNSTGAANSVPAGLTAYLVDNVTGKVVGTSLVATDGTYSISDVNGGTYKVVTSVVAAAIGDPAPAATPPTGFVQTGEFTGTPDGGTDAAVNGTSVPFTIATADQTNVNFGIQAPPTAGTDTAPSVVNPGGTASSTVPPATFSGTDPDGGTVESIVIKTIPVGATSITINGTKYDSTNPIPVGGITIPAPGGVPTQPILVDPVDGALTVPIEYFTKDNGGKESVLPGIANVPFEVCDLEIGGIVYLDNTGTTDGVNGTAIDGPILGSTGLHVAMYKGADLATAVFSGVQPISGMVGSMGSYKFTNVQPGTYHLVLTTVATGSKTPSLPITHITVSEGGTSTVGGTSAGDGTNDGKTRIIVDCAEIKYELPPAPARMAAQFGVNATASYLDNDFGIKLASTLPVDLLNFTARQMDEQINLTWKTANEVDFSHFEVQRSANAKEFGTIGTVRGNKSAFYNQIDANPKEGVNYYRLKMVDADGTSKLSNTISVSFDKDGSFVSIENPANNGEFKVMTNLKNPRFTLMNSLGQRIEMQMVETSNNNYTIKASSAAGLYYLNIVSNGKLVTKKVLIP
jgi:SdrD B-like domain